MVSGHVKTQLIAHDKEVCCNEPNHSCVIRVLLHCTYRVYTGTVWLVSTKIAEKSKETKLYNVQ